MYFCCKKLKAHLSSSSEDEIDRSILYIHVCTCTEGIGCFKIILHVFHLGHILFVSFFCIYSSISLIVSIIMKPWTILLLVVVVVAVVPRLSVAAALSKGQVRIIGGTIADKDDAYQSFVLITKKDEI